jgi:hypothetical protein
MPGELFAHLRLTEQYTWRFYGAGQQATAGDGQRQLASEENFSGEILTNLTKLISPESAGLQM